MSSKSESESESEFELEFEFEFVSVFAGEFKLLCGLLNPCENNGTCSVVDHSPECACPEDVHGDRCQNSEYSFDFRPRG